MRSKLSIVIVNWNTISFLRKCLLSIEKHTTGIDYEVIVVDNASTDGSPMMVRNEFPQVRLHAMKENLGFAKGNNTGVAASSGDYLLILNPDTEIGENALHRLVEFLDRTPAAVGVACRIIGPDGRRQPSSFKLPTVFTKWLFFSFAIISPWPIRPNAIAAGDAGPHKAEWISGAAMMLRARAFKEAGGFDENIFMFGEDIELCLRLTRMTGKSFYYCPDATIYHYGGASYNKSDIFTTRCSFRSACYYFNKHVSRRAANTFKHMTRFSWILLFCCLGLANLLSLGGIAPLKDKTAMYRQLLNTRADCLSGTS
jgi:GT2 family glycosyltransferase